MKKKIDEKLKKRRRRDFRIGFFCGILSSGIIAAILLAIMNF